jgi:2-keto-3-deoxy-L-rhamnonate aldolase RhmA
MPKSEIAASATARLNALYPEGGPGRQLKASLAAGEVLVGGTMSEYTRPSLMKLYQQAGYDFVYIEFEHIYFGLSALADTVLAARDNGLPVIAKTPQLDRQEVAKLLECGVVGIQLPRSETRQEIETLIDLIKLYPKGSRASATGYGSSDYIKPTDRQKWIANQDAETTLVVHIETITGYANAEEIVSTPGVDMVYCGPGDTSLEFGHPGDWDHPDVAGPMEKVLELCKQYGVPFGTSVKGPESAARWIGKGAQFFEEANELALILKGSKDIVDSYRAITGK